MPFAKLARLAQEKPLRVLLINAGEPDTLTWAGLYQPLKLAAKLLGPEVAQVFADLHRVHGVDLRLGAPVTADDLLAADLVVVGIGAAPATELAEAAEASEAIHADYESSRTTAIVVMVAGIALALALGWLVASGVARSARRVHR